MPDPAAPGVPVSVAMATYDGAAHVGEQVASILEQLGPHDEVVVVDDASRDDTLAVLATFDDQRLRVIASPANRGYVRAFESALRETRGDVVLLADQDDVWLPGRVALFGEALADHQVAASNLVLLGSGRPLRAPVGGRPWRLRSADSERHVANVAGILAGQRPYYGCAMGLRREALALALPFPAYLEESHDLWLALYGNLAGSIVHLDEPTLQRRVHESNATPDRPRGVRAALASRWMLARAAIELWRRVRSSRRRTPVGLSG